MLLERIEDLESMELYVLYFLVNVMQLGLAPVGFCCRERF